MSTGTVSALGCLKIRKQHMHIIVSVLFHGKWWSLQTGVYADDITVILIFMVAVELHLDGCGWFLGS